MSFLDLDEWLFDLAERVEVVYSPLMDIKDFPADVDLTLVEGAVANTDNLALIRQVRERTTTLVSFGDCAVTGNVTALRNPLGDPARMLERVYVDGVDRHGVRPDHAAVVPDLLPQVLAVHRVVPVDAYLPGCPPDADRIRAALTGLLDGTPGDHGIRFG
jgi:NAD-reducing hydrogenase small subunit